ncbi:MAG: hypothetical protein HYY50_05700 [Candidatus Kerfeldbacteria bacterium]|nr:hypothetical protein [Candidatus Kerfeldbacteria bacterium]
MNPQVRKLRIHGDNILECEHALELLSSSLNNKSPEIKLVASPPYAPEYELQTDSGGIIRVKLFPGYGRWEFKLEKYLVSRGASLREATDALITELVSDKDKSFEKPLLALEFSGALPAGNNAWQRSGRALALAGSHVPFLYFAEIGGVELDSARRIKAPRFPNPLVPFSYLAAGQEEGTICMPIYAPSPSIDLKNLELFKKCFGNIDALVLTRAIILDDKKGAESVTKVIREKAKEVVRILAEQRKKKDILTPIEWVQLLERKTGLEKAKWLINRSMNWRKKTGIKGLTPSFKKLILATQKIGASALGSVDMPMCILDEAKRTDFAKKVGLIYKNKVSSDFLTWLAQNNKPLAIVWVAGFKPRGDDSRPDRGLTPLVRMILGQDEVDMLTVIYGPAKPSTWKKLRDDMFSLSRDNGLWEAILHLSNGVIADSPTNKLGIVGFKIPKRAFEANNEPLVAALDLPVFGEHDIDSVIHSLFSLAEEQGIFEAMCNPPGGDWSGVNIFDFESRIRYRWTSLPRVSGPTTKRPDHLVQLNALDLLLTIESKESSRTLEKNIGPRLIKYVKTLISIAPNSFRISLGDPWRPFETEYTKKFSSYISGAAIKYKDENDLRETLKTSQTDIVFGVEFLPKEQSYKVVIHLQANKQGRAIFSIIKKLSRRFGGGVSVVEH